MKRFLALSIVLAGLASPAFAQKKPVAKATLSPAVAASVVRGKALYAQHCLGCHQADGGGAKGLAPPLNPSSATLQIGGRLVVVMLTGMYNQKINGESYERGMPSQKYLTDQQMADVLTYVRNNFGNKLRAINAADVKVVRRGVEYKSGDHTPSHPDTLGEWGAPR
jgi:mono/diheme cytochrome c family protein